MVKKNSELKEMNSLLISLILTSFTIEQAAMAQSRLLESVKRNPEEAKSLCQSFRELNIENLSASSPKSIQNLSTQKNISEVDAEVLAMYVRGLYCPETF